MAAASASASGGRFSDSFLSLSLVFSRYFFACVISLHLQAGGAGRPQGEQDKIQPWTRQPAAI